MAKISIQEHVTLGSLKVGRNVPNVTLQYKVQEILARPFQSKQHSIEETENQISQLRVERLWNTKSNHKLYKPIIKKNPTKH